MLPIAILTLSSLSISFFCSLLEACIYSVSRSHIESLRRAGKPSGRRLLRIRANIDEAIAAILILNTVANSAGAAWAGALVKERFGDISFVVPAVLIYAAFFTTSILFFSEIIPKSLGVKFANRIAPALAAPLLAMIWIFKPVVLVCVAVTRLWGQDMSLHHTTEEDIINLVALGQRSGQITADEARWISNALRLNDVTAYDLMTPNSVVARTPASLPLSKTSVDAQHWLFSRLPVCEDDNPDTIIGVVYRSKVFEAMARDRFELTMRDLMEPPIFVHEDTLAHELLDMFLNKRRHLFCVRDSADGFLGVVTLEDVMECLLGEEIVDESDIHVDMQEVAKQRRRQLLSKSREIIEKKHEERRRIMRDDLG